MIGWPGGCWRNISPLTFEVSAPTAGWYDLEGLIAEVAADRTTTLSRAFLACAVAGEADQDWHTLLHALAEGPMTNLPIYQSIDAILTHGATSGAAMLTGFFAEWRRLIPVPTPVEVPMPILTHIKPSEYHDSITLMLVAKALLEQPGVEDAAVVKGTPANREIIAVAGLLTERPWSPDRTTW